MTDAKSIMGEAFLIDHRRGNIFDGIDDLELQERLEKFEREIAELTFENSLFEKTLGRKKSATVTHHISSSVPPVSLSGTTTPNDSSHDLTNTSATSRGDRLSRKRSRSRSTQGDFPTQLTLEQKLHIAMSEYELIRNEENLHGNTYEKELDQFESDHEWIDGEIIDSEMAITDFLKIRNISIDKYTNKLIAEKIIHYFTERLKGRESLINKLRDRSIGFKRQIIRLDIQIRQKEDGGDTLQEVDFNQLKIENKQYLDKIDERNVELVLSKRQVSKFTQTLNHYKDQLQIKTQEFMDIQKRIDKQQVLYEYTQQEIIAVNQEQTRAKKKNRSLVEQTENYQVPEILDYVRKKALLYNLQRDCEVWQRKLELASMGLQQSKQKWQAVQRTARFSYYAGN